MPYVLPQPVRPVAAPYVVFKDFLTPEECQKVIDLSLGIKPEVAKIGTQANAVIDDKKRNAELFWIHYETAHEWLFAKLSTSIFSANNEWYGFHLAGLNEALQLTHYKADKSDHYDWHTDHANDALMSHRKLSGVILLKNAEEGGDFEFWERGKPAEMARGTLILFPSYQLHRVLPVVKGERWSLVFWVNGPPFV